MKLSVGDRLVLLSILPQESDFTTLKIVRKMKEDLSFSEDEHKALKFRFEDDRVFWEDTKVDRDIAFGEKATDIIVNAFGELDKQKRLKLEHMELYERFVGSK